MATHGEIFKQKRDAIGMTQEELSDALGMKQTSVSAVERGRFILSVPKAKRFAKLAHFEWTELYDYDEETAEELE